MITQQRIIVQVDVLRCIQQAESQWETSVLGDDFGYLNDAGNWVNGIELDSGSQEEFVRAATSEELRIHAAFKTVMEVVKGKLCVQPLSKGAHVVRSGATTVERIAHML